MDVTQLVITYLLSTVILISFLRKSILDFSLGVWGRSHQVILSLAVKTGRFWSAGDMIFGILWTQYLSSQRPNKKRVRSLGSVLTM